MKLSYGAYQSGIGRRQTAYLTVFTESKLIPQGFIEVATLNEFCQYGLLGLTIQLSKWVDGKYQEHSKNTLENFIAECPEIREFARQYYPHLVV